MGLYGKWVVPRLVDLAMRNHLLDFYRRTAINSARGLVLEIGVGSGLNISLYNPSMGRVVGLDPSPELLSLARKRSAQALVPISLIRASAENLPFADAAFDGIVMTWTLCSIPNPIAALDEMRRVLKPGRAIGIRRARPVAGYPGGSVQHRLTPYWKRISGGCHLDRKMDDLISGAGFQIDAVEIGYMKGPKPWTFMYQGSATR